LVFQVRKRMGNGAMSPLTNWDKFQKIVHILSKTKGWHRHDLRRPPRPSLVKWVSRRTWLEPR